MRTGPAAIPFLVLSLPLAAQQGDVAGEAQPPLPADLVIPPAAPLAWEEERAESGDELAIPGRILRERTWFADREAAAALES